MYFNHEQRNEGRSTFVRMTWWAIFTCPCRVSGGGDVLGVVLPVLLRAGPPRTTVRSSTWLTTIEVSSGITP